MSDGLKLQYCIFCIRWSTVSYQQLMGFGGCFCCQMLQSPATPVPTGSWVLGHGPSLNYSCIWCSILKKAPMTCKLHFLDSLLLFWYLEAWKGDSKIRQKQLLKGFFCVSLTVFCRDTRDWFCICYQKRLFIHTKEMCKSLHVQGWVRAILSRIKHIEYLTHYVKIEGIKVITKILKLWFL